jgi:N-acetylmuramoyl-L-alanine amidase
MIKEGFVRRSTVQAIQRFFAMSGFAAFVGIAVIVARVFGLTMPWDSEMTSQGVVMGAFNRQVALISGHAGYDSGAICTDAEGNVILTEAEVNALVATLAAGLLREAGADVLLLDEYDPRLDGLEVDVLLSLHADSCVDATGYKAAYYAASRIPTAADRFLACIDDHYAAVTGLPRHPDTVTVNMTEYHAFRKIASTTPAAILELGFLGGDQTLLTQDPARVARGVADSILCFLEQPPDNQTP